MNGRLWISKSLGLVSHKQAGLSGAAGTSRGFDAGRLFGLAAAVFFVAMAIFPQSVYSGARRGLDLWAGILVPSMLPFFILAEILMGSGILRVLGQLLRPLMRPLFNLPGEAGLGLALGYTSGFPMGAVITGRLYGGDYLSADEAGRLLAFTNNSSPGFLLTSLAAGMLAAPSAGWLLALCHYGANLFFGFCLGQYSRLRRSPAGRQEKGYAGRGAANNAAGRIAESVLAAGGAGSVPAARPTSFSRLVTSSISSAIQSILSLGGYVLLFSAAIQLFEDLGLLGRLAAGLQPLLPGSLSSVGLSRALASGIFEMTLGLNLLTSLSLPLKQVIPYCLLLLGWSGLSVQAQVAGLAGSARLPLKYYAMGCFLQPLLSLLLFGLVCSFFAL